MVMASSAALPRIGVLGGMGPLASAEFMVKLVHATPAQRDQEHFPTTLDSSPQIPDRPEHIYGQGADPMPAMIEVIRRLEAAGSALITMPCNTVHHWYAQLVAETSLPILHIADAAAAHLRATVPQAKRVGVLGSRVTSQLGIYSNRLGQEWDWVYASEASLSAHVMPAIAAVKSGDLPRGRALFLAAVNAMMEDKPDAIILACTEIPVVLTQADVPVSIIDSTEALAKYTIAVAKEVAKGLR